MRAYGRSPALDIPRKRSAPSFTSRKANVDFWWMGGSPVPAASARKTPASSWGFASRTQRVLRSIHQSQNAHRAAPRAEAGDGSVVDMPAVYRPERSLLTSTVARRARPSDPDADKIASGFQPAATAAMSR